MLYINFTSIFSFYFCVEAHYNAESIAIGAAIPKNLTVS